MTAKRYRVAGRVQGVFFRASTKQQADKLGVRGSAINLPDGRVEVLAVGESDAVRQLGDWLRRGPPLAEVSDVEELVEPGIDESAVTGFSCG